MTVARGAALGALALAVVVIAFVLLRGGGGAEYTLRFLSASGIVNDNDVLIGGRRVGTVKDVKLSDNNQAEVKVEIEDGYAPLHQGTTASIRQLSLSGIANRYVVINPGPNNAKELPEGTTLTAERTTSVVELDQLFNTLDPPTRKGLQDVIRGSADWYTGRTLDGKNAAKQFNLSTRYFGPFLSTTDQLVRELTRDEPALNRFLVDTSRVVSTLAARRDDLAGLISNTNATVRAIESENAALSRTLDQLPTTLRKGNTTFVNLRSALEDLDVLVTESKPATRRLAPFLRVLRPLVADAQPTIRDLRRLIREPGDANDTIDLLRRSPRLTAEAEKAFPSTVEALRGSQEIVEFSRPYGPDFIGFLRDFGQSASPYDANGHFARVQPIFNTYGMVDGPNGGVLTPLPPELRTNSLQNGLKLRCPGAATQPRPDGSNPFLDEGRLRTGSGGTNVDCDPTKIPPGP
jgi:phospholipid/cholesterol/gamma-HCH transport system substrate-binding protein